MRSGNLISNRPETWIGGTTATLSVVGAGLLVAGKGLHNEALLHVGRVFAILVVSIIGVLILLIGIIEVNGRIWRK